MDPRERYTLNGPDGLGDTELVALLVGTGGAGRSARDIARSLVDRFNGLAGVLQAPVGALSQVPGIGPARAVRVHAGLAAGQRAVLDSARPRALVDGPAAAHGWLSPRMAGLQVEELHALYLDRRLRLIQAERLTRGSDAFTIVDPRQVFRPAVGCGASAVIVGHNHPSGDPTPSDRDLDVTRRLSRAGKLLGVALLDHLVVAGPLFRSIAETGGVVELGWPPQLCSESITRA